ncbi:hypothetical protein AB8B12_13565, partial [Streptomyces sp. PGLac3x]
VPRHRAHTAAAEHGVAACSAAVAGVLDALRDRVLEAAHAALPQSWRTRELPRAGDGRLPDEAAGVAVLAAEVANVVRAVSVAEEYRHHTTALLLARALWPLQLKAGYWDEALPALRLAARCADRHQPDSAMAGALHFQLAHCLGELGRAEEGEREARAAVACERAAGHLRGEASSVELLGLLAMQSWDYPSAYEHFVATEALYRGITSGQEGGGDLPRAFALVGRHQGRALRGMGRLGEARPLLEAAVEFFAEQGEAYNQARALHRSRRGPARGGRGRGGPGEDRRGGAAARPGRRTAPGVPGRATAALRGRRVGGPPSPDARPRRCASGG